MRRTQRKRTPTPSGTKGRSVAGAASSTSGFDQAATWTGTLSATIARAMLRLRARLNGAQGVAKRVSRKVLFGRHKPYARVIDVRPELVRALEVVHGAEERLVLRRGGDSHASLVKNRFFLKRSFFLKKNKKKGFFTFELSRLRVPKKDKRKKEWEKKTHTHTPKKNAPGTMGRYGVIRCSTGSEEFSEPEARSALGPPMYPISPPFERFISDVNRALAAGASLVGGASIAVYKGCSYWTQTVMYP